MPACAATRAVAGGVRDNPALYRDSPADSASFVPRSVVCAETFDWDDDRSPGRPLAESVIYEAHVKGFTRLHPDVPEPLRGTYAGLAHPAAIDHLRRLGVTAVELLPVHQFVHDAALLARGLRNYWGYQSIGYFAPHNEYSSAGEAGEQVAEFKAMVRALHAAGVEVILDVVFNHNEISWIDWRGIDPDRDLTGLVARLCRLRRNSPLLRRGRFLSRDELAWLRPDGAAMTDGDWANPDARAIVAATPGARLLVNACWEPLTFSPPKGEGWSLELDTTELERSWAAGTPIELAGRSLVLLARADGAPQ